MVDPFGDDVLARLFETDAARPNLLKRRESTTLELKENFNLSSDAKALYGRSMAGFANREGGYLLFGVKDRPHELVGMTNENFENFEPTQLQQFLAGQFAPAIDWVHYMHRIGDRSFGLIYVHAARTKPIVSVKQGPKDLRDGDIYYRYQGETKRIGSAELQQIINDRVEAERHGWHAFLKKAATITPASAVILDTLTGQASTDGRRFVKDEKLVEEPKYIQQGRFEEGGHPTLRVHGDVEVARPEAIVVERPEDLARSFPHLTRDVVRLVNERIEPQRITSNDVSQVLKRNCGVAEQNDWHYRNPVLNSSPQYSQAFVDWICQQCLSDKEFLPRQREQWKTSRRTASK